MNKHITIVEEIVTDNGVRYRCDCVCKWTSDPFKVRRQAVRAGDMHRASEVVQIR